jgi:hypothetical protein
MESGPMNASEVGDHLDGDLISDQIAVFNIATDVCAEREKKYNGLWMEYGWRGCLLHLKSKVARIERAINERTLQADLDDAFDLINYTGFLIRCAAHGLEYEPGVDEDVFLEKVLEFAQDPVNRARILEALGVNGGVHR